MPIGAVLAGVQGITGLIGAGLQSSAAQQAAQAQAKASQQNLDFENNVYNTASGQFTPTVNQGQAAGSALAGLLGIGGNPAASTSAFNNYLGSTNYNFLKSQGEQALGFLNAPNLQSGATGKALINYGQGMANNALYGYEGLLQGQQGLGLNAAEALAGTGTNIAAQEANARNLAAGAQGSAGLYGANAWTGALGGLSSAFNQGVTQSSFGANGNPFGLATTSFPGVINSAGPAPISGSALAGLGG